MTSHRRFSVGMIGLVAISAVMFSLVSDVSQSEPVPASDEGPPAITIPPPPEVEPPQPPAEPESHDPAGDLPDESPDALSDEDGPATDGPSGPEPVIGPPTVVVSPGPQSPCTGQTLSLTVLAEGSHPIGYRWQRDGTDLIDDGRIFGSSGATLHIHNVTTLDSGRYVCLITTGGGSVASQEALVQISSRLVGDFDGDCDVDGIDRGHFIACRSGTSVLAGPGCADADLDGDGDVDQSDFGLLQMAMTGGGGDPAPQPADDEELPVAVPGGPYIATGAGVPLNGSGSLPGSTGSPIVSYRWDLPPGSWLFDRFPGTTLDTGAWQTLRATQNDGLELSGTNSWGSGYVIGRDPVARGSGFTCTGRFTPGSGYVMWGLKQDDATFNNGAMLYNFYFDNGNLRVNESGANRATVSSYVGGVPYELRIDVKPGMGALYYFRLAGATDWGEPVYDSTYADNATLRPGVMLYNGTHVLHDLRAPAMTASGVAANRLITQPGQITLTVTDGGGRMGTAQTTVSLGGSAPLAEAGGPVPLAQQGPAEHGLAGTLNGSGTVVDAGWPDPAYSWALPPGATELSTFDGTVIDASRWYTQNVVQDDKLTVSGSNSWGSGRIAGHTVLRRSEGAWVEATITPSGGYTRWGLKSHLPEFGSGTPAHSFYFDNGNLRVTEDGANRYTVGGYSAGTAFDVRIETKPAGGARYFVRLAGTTAWPAAVFETDTGTTEYLVAAMNTYSGNHQVDDVRVPISTATGAVLTRRFAAEGSADLTVTDGAARSSNDTASLILGGPAPVAHAGGPYVLTAGDLYEIGLWGPITLDGSASGIDPSFPDPRWTWAAPSGSFGVDTFDGTVLDAANWYTLNTVQDEKLTVSGSNSWGSGRAFRKSVLARGAGFTVRARITPSGGYTMWGLKHHNIDFGTGTMAYAIYFNNGNLRIYEDGSDRGGVGSYSGGTTYEVRIDVAAGNGAQYYFRLAGAEGWTNLYNSVYGSSDLFLPGLLVYSGGHMMDDLLLPLESFDGPQIQCMVTGEGVVGLTLTDAAGRMDADVTPLEAEGAPPIADAGGPYITPFGTATQFDASGSTDDSGILAYRWDFGDGTTLVSQGAKVAHSYLNPGLYQVSLMVTDHSGGAAATSTTVEVRNAVVAVPWAFEPLSGGEIPHDTWSGKAIRLKAVYFGPQPAGELTYTWTFGDGSAPETGAVTDKRVIETMHTYNAATGAIFRATITIEDTVGGTWSDDYFVIVSDQSLDTEVNVAIDEGLWFLHKSQQPAGNWNSYENGWPTSATASSLQAFCINGHRPQGNGLQDPYVETVSRGFDYLFTRLATQSIAGQTFGDPDSNGNGIGLTVTGNRQIYEGGMVIDAIASSGAPDRVALTGPSGVIARTYRDILQDMLDQYAWGQDDAGGNQGGWRYSWNSDADNSAAQWAAIGYLGARAFGFEAPGWVKDQNAIWLDASRLTDGRYGYTGRSFCCGWYATTPSGLVQLAWIGVPKTDSRWTGAEDYISTRWNEWRDSNNVYAWYAFAKAMRLAVPTPVVNLGATSLDWYHADTTGLARKIVNAHQADGGWNTDPTWNLGRVLTTSWQIIILNPTLFTLAPVANAGDDVVWAFDLELPFDGSQSFHLDPTRQIVLYEWDFDGDGTYDYVGTNPVTSHTYVFDPGITYPITYEARLRVTDDAAEPQTDTDTRRVTIAEPPHAPFAVPGGPYTAVANFPFTPDGSGSFDIDPTDFITRYEWDFDGSNGFDFDNPDAVCTVSSPGETCDVSWTYSTNGEYNIGLRVWDNGVLNAPTFDSLPSLPKFTTVRVISNQAPIADAGGPYEVNECATIALDGSGSSDPDNQPLTFMWDLNNDGNFGDAAGVAPSFSSDTDGSFTVGLIVSDGLLESDPDYAQVTVRDSEPTVTLAGPALLTIDEEGDFTATVPPICDDIASVEWDWDYDNVTFTPSGDTGLMRTHSYPVQGTYRVAVRVTDEDGSMALATLDVVVAPVTGPRVPAGERIDVVVGRRSYDSIRKVHRARFKLVSAHDQPIRAPIALAFVSFDPSSIVLLNPDGEVPSPDNPNTLVPYISFDDVLSGPTLDPGESTAEKWIEFSDPLNVAFLFDARAYLFNAPPRITSTPVTTGREGERYRYQVTAVDDDGDPVRFALIDTGGTPPPAGMTIGQVSGMIDWRPGQMDAGLHPITVVVTDGLPGGTATQAYLILVGDTNVPPVITSIPPGTGMLNEPYLYQVVSKDPDGDPLAYELLQGPAGMGIDGTGLVSWMPTATGGQDVEIAVRDDHGHETTQAYLLTILACAQPPVISSSPPLTATEGTPYQYQVQATVGSGSLSYSLGTAPTGMSINASGLLTWLPSYMSAGARVVKVIVSADTPDCRTEQIFTINVTDVNAPPRFVSAPVTTAAEGVAYQYDAAAQDPDGDSLTYRLLQGPAGMTMQPQVGRLSWTPPQDAAAHSPFAVMIEVVDPHGARDQQDFQIAVTAEDLAPRITSTPVFLAIEGSPYAYDVEATDPDNDPLTFALLEFPAGMTIDENTGLISWLPDQAAALASPHNVRVQASDPGGHTAEQAYQLFVRATNEPPVITSAPAVYAVEGDIYLYDVNATDPDGDTLIYSLTVRPDGMNIHPVSGLIDWLVPQTAAASAPIAVTIAVSDGVETVEQSFLIDIEEVNVNPTVNSAPVTVAVVGFEYQYDVNAVDQDENPVEYELLTAPDGMTIDRNTGLIVWMPAEDQVGTQNVEVLITDGAGGSLTHAFSITVSTNPDDLQDPDQNPDLPVITIVSPAPGQDITAPVDIVGSISDNNPADIVWEIRLRRNGSSTAKVIAAGNGPVADGVLATIDPTVLPNDPYTAEVVVTDGRMTRTLPIPINVSGDLKLGNFTLSFTDLSVPVAGIPMVITRQYSSLDTSVGDFGPGWRLGLPGKVVDEPREDANEGLRIGSKVYVTRPDGKRVGFITTAVPVNFLFYWVVNVEFVPDDGVGEELTIAGPPQLYINGGGILLDGFSGPLNPRTYQLKTKQNLTYIIDEIDGLQSITDLNGNVITVQPGGLISSAGPALVFDRDAEGRITRISEPADGPGTPAYVEYVYDNTTGNLKEFWTQKRSDPPTTFDYEEPGFPHYLTRITDPLGRVGIRNEFDDDGRLTASIDADGNRVEFAHDVGARQEVVTDREGYPSVTYYDDRGNVIQRTDSYGSSTFYEYLNGYVVRETDCAGRVKTYTYDGDGDLLTETNCSGGITTYTRNGRGQPLTRTDPRGHVTRFEYDARGNLIKQIDPFNAETTYTYDSVGNRTSVTNPLGQTETFTYDASGQVTTHTDFSGAVTEYTYNTAGDRLTETRQRTGPGGAEAITITNVYNERHRVVEQIDTYGNSLRWEYDAADQIVRSIDQLNRVTENVYDLVGNLVETRFPDGTMEMYEFNSESRRTALTDRNGHTTRYEYDRLGRQVKTIYPDGTPGDDSDNPYVETVFDCIGRVVDQYDERRGRTHYEHHCLPNEQLVTDALGNVTRHEFDLSGNRVSSTDALNHTTTYTYDALNRLSRTTYPDGSFSQTFFDVDGRKSEDVDQAGRVTRYEYDAMDRATSIILTEGGEELATHHAYDELGNQIAQTDPAGRVTTYEYDRLGRRTKKTLPLGQAETSTYDAGGRLATHTDFNGRTTTYAYDTANRLIRETTPDGGYHEFDYNGIGKRTLARIVPPGGGSADDTVTQYDARERIVMVTNPDGSTLTYEYDAAGNRTSLVSQTPELTQTTTYDYDALNRLSQVHHPEGGISTYAYDAAGNRASLTMPNGTVTSYTYDNLNRLTEVANRKADTSLISRYVYTLSPSGQRTRMDETTPAGDTRVVQYTYDDTYRLVGEQITDPAATDLVITYKYDKAANRTERKVVGDGNTITTVYTYDANDRLLDETVTTQIAAAARERRMMYASSGAPIPSRANYRISVTLLGITGAALFWPGLLFLPRRRGMGKLARRRRIIVQTIALFFLPTFLVDVDIAGRLHLSGIAYKAYGDPGDAEFSTDSTTYTYDANGNTLTRVRGGNTDRYTWDDRNQLVAAENRTADNSDTTFAYDTDGLRIAKTVAGVSSTDYLVDKNRDFAQVLTETIDPTAGAVQSVAYVYGDDLIAMNRPDSGVSFYHMDGQMSVRQLTGTAAAVNATYAYDAFGVPLHSTGAIRNDYRYVSEQYDPNLGFTYLRARYYDAQQGRFASADPAEPRKCDPRSLHRYLYANANPVAFHDPSGLTVAAGYVFMIQCISLPLLCVIGFIQCVAASLIFMAAAALAAAQIDVGWVPGTATGAGVAALDSLLNAFLSQLGLFAPIGLFFSFWAAVKQNAQTIVNGFKSGASIGSMQRSSATNCLNAGIQCLVGQALSCGTAGFALSFAQNLMVALVQAIINSTQFV